jgi:hypothetical protein
MDSTRRKGNTIKKTAEEKNKDLVLEAFDTRQASGFQGAD